MREELFYFISISAISALVSAISYGAQDSKIKLSLGIMLFASVLTPTVGIIRSLGDFRIPEYSTGDYGNMAEEVAEEAFCRGIRRAVADKFSISEEEISVETVGFCYSEMSAERITLELSGRSASSDTRGIRGYIEREFGECEVKIKIEG